MKIYIMAEHTADQLIFWHFEIGNPGDQIKLQQGIRHRLVGLKDFGVVAEIWQHTDPVPSDEDDIIRVQDDFGR